jgi:hypothetical protein
VLRCGGKVFQVLIRRCRRYSPDYINDYTDHEQSYTASPGRDSDRRGGVQRWSEPEARMEPSLHTDKRNTVHLTLYPYHARGI